MKDIKQYALFLCKVALLLELAESRTYFTGLRSFRS